MRRSWRRIWLACFAILVLYFDSLQEKHYEKSQSAYHPAAALRARYGYGASVVYQRPGWPVKIPRLWSLQNPPPEARLTVQ